MGSISFLILFRASKTIGPHLEEKYSINAKFHLKMRLACSNPLQMSVELVCLQVSQDSIDKRQLFSFWQVERQLQSPHYVIAMNEIWNLIDHLNTLLKWKYKELSKYQGHRADVMLLSDNTKRWTFNERSWSYGLRANDVGDSSATLSCVRWRPLSKQRQQTAREIRIYDKNAHRIKSNFIFFLVGKIRDVHSLRPNQQE